MTRQSKPTTDQLVEELCARVQALEEWRTHQSDLIDELLNGIPDTPSDDDAEDDVPGVDTSALIDWVHDKVSAIIARPLRGEFTWCPLWWEHPEAVMRLEALRRAWTELVSEPGAAMSIWIRDHLDPCLRELLSPLGPFADCIHSDRYRSRSAHTPLATLPTATPDRG